MSIPIPPILDANLRITWGFLGEEGTTQDGYRVKIRWGPSSRRYVAHVWTPSGAEHETSAPSTVLAKRAAGVLIDALRARGRA
jgi:hypothetical protein